MHEIVVSLTGRDRASYPVLIGRNLLPRIADLLARHCPARRYAVIADHHVAELHGARLMDALKGAQLEAKLFPFPSGEWNKTRDQWAALTDALLAWKIGRDGAVIGFGGGVAGDLAGFVAATLQRGLPLVQLPTTLLAMVDASVGGKTALDVPAGKNLVGAFHAPHMVVADIDLLATLPKTQLASGMAEVIKHGLVADEKLFASLEDPAAILAKDCDRLEEIVRTSIAIKAAVVGEDEREQGRRAVLNFGHTVGHAIELLSGYELLHGEAIAIGMTAEAMLAERAGVAKDGMMTRVSSMLERYRLPTRVPEDLANDALIEAMKSDKKTRGGEIHFALPSRIGAMARGEGETWTIPIEESLIRQVLDSRK